MKREDEFMKKLNEYIAPSLSVTTFASSDVITTSPGDGFDTFENWQRDVFLEK